MKRWIGRRAQCLTGTVDVRKRIIKIPAVSAFRHISKGAASRRRDGTAVQTSFKRILPREKVQDKRFDRTPNPLTSHTPVSPKTEVGNAEFLTKVKRLMKALQTSLEGTKIPGENVTEMQALDPESKEWERFEANVGNIFLRPWKSLKKWRDKKLWDDLDASMKNSDWFHDGQRVLHYAFIDQVVDSQKTDTAVLKDMSIDLRYPTEWYFKARAMQRDIHLHVGPTNSGKTYNALKRLEEAGSGFYAGPLRLLAHEVYSRFKASGVPCDLVTGDDVRLDSTAEEVSLYASTVEMVDVGRSGDVAVIDEIQMMADEDRGWAWTRAFLGANTKEVHLCGEPRVVPLIRELAASMGDTLHIHQYERLNPLKAMSTSLQGSLNKLRKGDCIVSFTIIGIHALKKQIEVDTGRRVAIIYGGLPPETRAQQAALFNDPDNDYDFLVASDAIGMGLNLSIKRIIFETVSKWNGRARQQLDIPSIKQIAGRAGRYRSAHADISKSLMKSQPASETETETEIKAAPSVGLVTCLDGADLPIIQQALQTDPVPLRSAGILPPTEFVEQYAARLPKGVPFNYIFRKLCDDASLHPRFRMCDITDQMGIGRAIEPVKGLSLAERHMFVASPANHRDIHGQAVVRAIAACIAEHRNVTVADIPEIPLEVLEQPLSPDREYLQDLERLHKSLILFLWLSYRFMNVLKDQDMAKHAKDLTEEKINTCLLEFSANPHLRKRLLEMKHRLSSTVEQDGQNADPQDRESDGARLTHEALGETPVLPIDWEKHDDQTTIPAFDNQEASAMASHGFENNSLFSTFVPHSAASTEILRMSTGFSPDTNMTEFYTAARYAESILYPSLHAPLQTLPPAWAKHRNDLAESLDYFRVRRKNVYISHGVVLGCIFGRDSGDNTYLDSEVLIAKVASTAEAPVGFAYSRQRADMESKLAAWQRTKDLGASVVVILSRTYPKLSIHLDEDYAYAVLENFRITETWAERDSSQNIVFMVKLEKCNLLSRSWWTPNQSDPPESRDTRIGQGVLVPQPVTRCDGCGQVSPNVYSEVWLCLNYTCDFFFTCNDVARTPAPRGLTFHPPFLTARAFSSASPDYFLPSYGLFPDLMDSLREIEATGQIVSQLSILWKGIRCPQCHALTPKVYWHMWACTECDGGFNVYFNPGQIHLRGLIPRISVSYAGYPPVEAIWPRDDVDHQGPIFKQYYRVDKWSLHDGGRLILISPASTFNEDEHGPNTVFTEVLADANSGSFNLHRPEHNESLASHFEASFGKAYGASDHSPIPFKDAEPSIIRSGTILDRVCREELRTQYVQPNSLQLLAYIDGMHLPWHTDGAQNELGDTVATLSLGSDAIFRIRLKATYYNNTNAFGPDGEVVQGAKNWRAVRDMRSLIEAGIDPGSVNLFQESYDGYYSTETPKRPEIALPLIHGSILIMQGKSIQNYYEHCVEPQGPLRFAITARYVNQVAREDHLGVTVTAGRKFLSDSSHSVDVLDEDGRAFGSDKSSDPGPPLRLTHRIGFGIESDPDSLEAQRALTRSYRRRSPLRRSSMDIDDGSSQVNPTLQLESVRSSRGGMAATRTRSRSPGPESTSRMDSRRATQRRDALHSASLSDSRALGQQSRRTIDPPPADGASGTTMSGVIGATPGPQTAIPVNRWTATEQNRLLQLRGQGLEWAEVARQLGTRRTAQAVRRQAMLLRNDRPAAGGTDASDDGDHNGDDNEDDDDDGDVGDGTASATTATTPLTTAYTRSAGFRTARATVAGGRVMNRWTDDEIAMLRHLRDVERLSFEQCAQRINAMPANVRLNILRTSDSACRAYGRIQRSRVATVGTTISQPRTTTQPTSAVGGRRGKKTGQTDNAEAEDAGAASVAALGSNTGAGASATKLDSSSGSRGKRTRGRQMRKG